ncbi:MAG: VOC family protein [Pseudomonadota bacterium]
MTNVPAPRIDYLELAATDMAAMKTFYAAAFGWRFTDYGPGYASFAKEDAGLDGGFDADKAVSDGGPLIVFFTDDIKGAEARIVKAGGVVNIPVFEFPGGRRFHFKDPSGNELAVWST